MFAQPKVIGPAQQYEVEKTIASGAFSRVYRCRERTTGQRYAAKVVSKTMAEKFHMTESLQREAEAMRRIGTHCPHVVKLVDAFVSPHNYYFIMGLAEGGTLLDYARASRLTHHAASSPSGASSSGAVAPPPALPAEELERVAFFTKQLLLGLESIHACSVVHRDIKPENLLLDKSRTRLLISDFGFACYAPEGHMLHRACGTLRYCAPELLEEDPCYDGRKVDVWAAGVTVYVLLFKTHPYRSNKCAHAKSAADDFLTVILQANYTLPKAVPAEVADFLDKALRKDPEERWSVSQLLAHPWMTAVDLCPLGEEDDESLTEVFEQSRTNASSVETAVMARPASTASVSSLAAHLTRSTWDSLLEVDDGFYNVSQVLQGSRTGMSDSQGESSRTVPATSAQPAPPYQESDSFDDPARSPYMSGEWAVAGAGRTHAAQCPHAEYEHPVAITDRAVRVLQIIAFTLLNVILHGVGRLCRTAGLRWRYPPNAEDFFGAVDAAIAAERRASQSLNDSDGADGDFDTVFDNLFDNDFFGQAVSGLSAGPRLPAVLGDDEADAVDLRRAPRLPKAARRKETTDDDEPQGVTPHGRDNGRHESFFARLSSSTQASDMLANKPTLDGLFTDHCGATPDTPTDNLVCILDSPSNGQSSLGMELPCSPSAPLPSSKVQRRPEDFPSVISRDAITNIH